MKRLKTAVIGTGFMGRMHLEALRRVEFVDVAAIVSRERDTAEKLGFGFGIPPSSYESVLADPSIDAVHICTPNVLHYSQAKQALLAGKHVLCEKPLAVTVEQAEELVTLAEQQNLRNCVCHNLRFYPMVQQMRQMCASGGLGEIFVVQGTYSQDWLLYNTDWNWRIDESVSGSSRAMADIGSHWFDMAEHLTGLRVHSLCADWNIFHTTRRRPTQSSESFADKLSTNDDAVEVTVTTEDFGAVLFRMGQHARGAMTASQVSAGRKNALCIEIYGSKSGVAWNQERPDELWIGNRNSPNQTIVKDPSLLGHHARAFADLPGGHSEGYDDTFKQLFRRFYHAIRTPDTTADYPQMADGLRQMHLLAAQRQSSLTRSWVELLPLK